MVVGCPKCKCRLTIPDEKIKPGGSKVKCPKCSAVLAVKRPSRPEARPEAVKRGLDRNKIFVAHESPGVVERIKAALSAEPYMIVTAPDGVGALVQVMKELPFLYIIDAGLPKISGYEIARRLRENDDTREAKVILVCSEGERHRQPKQPASAYGVDEYVDEADIEKDMAEAVAMVIIGKKLKPATKPASPEPSPATAAPQAGAADAEVERAKRLSRTVLSDIDLYSPDKVNEAVRSNTFQSIFAEDLKEGLKHYESRIPPEIRARGNFFQEAIDEFIARKKKLLGL